jgi:hypothetical protein
MPFKQIDTVLSWAKPIKALVFLDIQGTQYGKSRGARIRKVLALQCTFRYRSRVFFKNGEIPGSKMARLLRMISMMQLIF